MFFRFLDNVVLTALGTLYTKTVELIISRNKFFFSDFPCPLFYAMLGSEYKE